MRALQRALQLRLALHDVQAGHWVFLRVLWQRDGLTKRELSIEAGVTEPTTFVALRAMEALGYVTLQQRSDNRKNVHVRLTPRGRRLEKTLVPLTEQINTVALQSLSDADIAAARRVLLTLIGNNLSRDAGVGPCQRPQPVGFAALRVNQERHLVDRQT